MELNIGQQIYYSNKELVPLREIADSLIALESIIKLSPEVLERLFPGTQISGVEVFLNELRSDSIWEDVVIKFIFGSQAKFDEIITDTRSKIGLELLSQKPKLLSAIILTMILSGGVYYVNKYKTDSSEQKITIEGNNNTVIAVGAGLLNIPAEDFKKTIDTAVKDKDKLARDAARIIMPAKRDVGANIKFNDDEELQVTSDTVKAIPRHVIEPEPEEFIEEIEAADIIIRAVDLDSYKRGWAVVVPALSERRVRLQIDSKIDAEYLMLHPHLKGDITVVMTYDNDKKKIPKLVYLKELADKDK